MKWSLIFVFIFCIIALSLFGQTIPHSDRAYVVNPDLARIDALSYAENGSIQEAIICYKKYAALTGKDMSSEILELKKKQYPDWFDASCMLAIPMNDEQVLVVYKELKSCDVWAIPKSVIVSGIGGEWSAEVEQKEFNVILQSGLYIPVDGLYSSCTRSLESIFVEFRKKSVTGRVLDVKSGKEIHEKLSVALMTASGSKSINCGYYITEPKLKDFQIVDKITDRRVHFTVYYYPTRIIRYDNGIWQMEDSKYKYQYQPTNPTDSSSSLVSFGIVVKRRIVEYY